MRNFRQALSLTLLLFWITPITAGLVTVDQSEDPIDIDPWTATIHDLPGPDGKVSFSEAIIATNNTPGKDTVAFAIPQDDWIWQWLYPGCAVIVSGYTYYWRANDLLVIDGTTQTAFTGDTNPDGAEVVIYQDEFYFNAGESALYGLHAVAVTFSGSANIASGNTGGSNITLFGGTDNLVQGNVCGTIKIDRSSNNVITSNLTDRVRVWGFGANQPAVDNRIGGPGPGDRNFITGYGTWNSEGLPSGTTVEIVDATGTILENNWIGTTTDGLAQGNLASTQGIWLFGTNTNTIIRSNRIAGILGEGRNPHHAGQLFGRAILISGSGSGVTIEGNTIGLNANDEPVLGSITGVDIGNDAGSTVDDITLSANVIAGHLFNGLTVGHDVPQVRLSANSFFANTSLGIDLIPDGYGYGVTPNDPLDADNGGSGLQNFPVLDEAVSSGSSLSVTGSLHSYPGSEFTLQFFASDEGHPTGHGEGQTFVGEGTVNTDGAGDVSFDLTFPIPLDPGCVITATATLEPLGATSEFSGGVLCTDGRGNPVVECTLDLISPTGGEFVEYVMTFTNTSDTTQNRDIWMEVTGPDGYDEVAFQRNINFRALSGKSKARAYRIRGSAAGDYTLTLFTGTYPDSIDDSNTQVYNRTFSIASESDLMGMAANIPVQTSLRQNHPNPFNPSTGIRYTLAEPSFMTLTVYNVLGQSVRTLVSAHQNAGSYEAVWDGRNAAGDAVSSGVYFYRMQAVSPTGEHVDMKKMLMMK